ARPPSACCAPRWRGSPLKRTWRTPRSCRPSPSRWRRTPEGAICRGMSQALHIQDQIAPVSFKLFETDFAAFTKALGDSYARWGLGVRGGPGMPQDKVDAALDQMKAFFALPEAAKLAYKLPVAGQRGYTPFGVETAKGATHFDLKEFWHVGRDLPPGHPFRDHMTDNVWPDA